MSCCVIDVCYPGSWDSITLSMLFSSPLKQHSALETCHPLLVQEHKDNSLSEPLHSHLSVMTELENRTMMSFCFYPQHKLLGHLFCFSCLQSYIISCWNTTLSGSPVPVTTCTFTFQVTATNYHSA